jgi:DNA-binding response OmpR family regulator
MARPRLVFRRRGKGCRPSRPGPGMVRLGDDVVLLNPIQTSILFSLMCRPKVPAALMSEVVWPDPDTMPDRWNDLLRVEMTRLRAKLRAFGVRITTVYGQGYTMEPLA